MRISGRRRTARTGRRVVLCLLALCPARAVHAQRLESLAPAVRRYVRVGTSRVILEHVQVIDGTGAGPLADRNVVIEAGKIAAILPGGDETPAEGTALLDLRGNTILPGIVGMHEHLFYIPLPNLAPDGTFERPALFQQMSFSAPRLYLANGVTTARTTGSVETYTDLRLKEAIEKGTLPGPHFDVTGPYLEGRRAAPLRLPARFARTCPRMGVNRASLAAVTDCFR